MRAALLYEPFFNAATQSDTTIRKQTLGIPIDNYVKTEGPAFPPFGGGVETAIPAFVGYTEKAEVSGRPAFGRPIPINSLDEFRRDFGGPPRTTFDVVDGTADDFDVMSEDNVYRKLKPAGHVGLLYYSLCLFYANGGAKCFVVSVGQYGSGVSASDLKEGVESLEDEAGPTLLVVPDLSLLPIARDSDASPRVEGFKAVVAAMLDQCGKKRDRVALLDVVHAREIDGTSPRSELHKAIEQFRADVDHECRNYGIAYFPYLNASVVQTADLDDTVFEGAGALAPAIVKAGGRDFRNAVPKLAPWYAAAARKLNRLPATAAMAGVMTSTDKLRGVWNAPANIGLNAVNEPTVRVTDDEQSDFNTPLDGKAINLIREFIGRGPVVWGARTLDGNSNDYRYVQVRRTLIYIEQTVKAAMNPFVAAPNDGKTWAIVTSMISSFLQDLWARGGLQGATARDAFSVDCGLGTTMTGRDVLEGYLVARIVVAMVRPAEFIELTFKQKMEHAS